MLRFLIVFLVWLSAPGICLAEGIFGPEWTFTSPAILKMGEISDLGQQKIQENALKDVYRERWLQRIRSKCPLCTIQENVVTLPGGYWFKIFRDPMVLEVNATPVTQEEFSRVQDQVQALVFDSAREVGLIPDARVGGGHIHLDRVSHFANDPLLIRNFIVDIFNHPELFMGALSLDYLNAPPVALGGAQLNRVLQNLLAAYDRNEFSIEELLFRIQKDVYLDLSLNKNDWNLVNQSNYLRELAKYRALNLNPNGEGKTFEIRGFRPQKSAAHYFAMTKLIERRIQYLKNFKTPIAYIPKDYSALVSSSVRNELHTYETKLDPQTILSSFRSFVEESGLNWSDYKQDLADPHLLPFLDGATSPLIGKLRCDQVF